MASNFIIIADDYLALEQKIEEIKKGFEVTSETIQYNLGDEGIYALIDELTTISLFDETKFVIAKNAEVLLGKSEKAFVELLKAMNDQSSSNILILIFMNSADYASEAFQKLKRFSSVIEIKTKNINFEEYAKVNFEKDGFQVEESTIKLLVSYADTLSKLRGFMDQLECYTYEKRRITEDDVTHLVSQPLDDNVYALIDAVLSNNKKLMLKGYYDMKLKVCRLLCWSLY